MNNLNMGESASGACDVIKHTELDEHIHEWQPNGVTKQDEVSYSPVSAMDHQVRTVEYAIQSCLCGKVKRTAVGASSWRWLNRRNR